MRGSRGIQDFAGALYRPSEIWVLEGRWRHQVDRETEKLFEAFFWAEVGVESAESASRVELNLKIHVATVGIEFAGRGRTEHRQGGHLEPPTQLDDSVTLLGQVVQHDLTSVVVVSGAVQVTTLTSSPRLKGRLAKQLLDLRFEAFYLGAVVGIMPMSA